MKNECCELQSYIIKQQPQEIQLQEIIEFA